MGPLERTDGPTEGALALMSHRSSCRPAESKDQIGSHNNGSHPARLVPSERDKQLAVESNRRRRTLDCVAQYDDDDDEDSRDDNDSVGATRPG